MSGKRIYELTEKSNLENDYFMALDKSGTANAQKVNVSKILNPINNISGSADEYSSTKAYAVGDLVIHDNKLYKCTTACSAAAWSTNQGYFTQSTLTTELTNVKSSLSDISDLQADDEEVLIGYTSGGRAIYKKRLIALDVTNYSDAGNRRRFTLITIPNCGYIRAAKGRIMYDVDGVEYQAAFGETLMNADCSVQLSSWVLITNSTSGTVFADVNKAWKQLTSISVEVVIEYSKPL